MTLGLDNPEALIAQYGRSFHLASRFLPRHARERAIRLYGFCRLLDDLADGSGSSEAGRRELNALLENWSDAEHPLLQAYRRLNLRDDAPARALVAALAADTGPRQLATWEALIQYAHGVAGTVGLMMAEILGATDDSAPRHALDLGMAMQLINIARDVTEDAKRDRVYVPAAWLPADLTPAAILREPERAWPAVSRLINAAEPYFASGFAGLRYLPPSARRGIWIAGRVYREIGQRVLQRGPSGLRERAIVSARRKFSLAARSRLAPTSRTPWGGSGDHHSSRLHADLTGYCGVASRDEPGKSL